MDGWPKGRFGRVQTVGERLGSDWSGRRGPPSRLKGGFGRAGVKYRPGGRGFAEQPRGGGTDTSIGCCVAGRGGAHLHHQRMPFFS